MEDTRIFISNCHGFNSGIAQYLRELSSNVDIFLLQETWLSDSNCYRLGEISNDFVYFHSSSMEAKLCTNILTGRPPLGGVTVQQFTHCKVDYHTLRLPLIIVFHQPRFGTYVTLVRCRIRHQSGARWPCWLTAVMKLETEKTPSLSGVGKGLG
jgi:hypothetical protein